MVSRAQFGHGRTAGQALMIGTVDHVVDKPTTLHPVTGFDRAQALLDWGGLPLGLVEASLTRLGSEIAPALREAAARTSWSMRPGVPAGFTAGATPADRARRPGRTGR